MSNEILKAIKSHRSIRKYQNRPIPKEVMDEILLAGTRASSSGNMQAYSIIVTTDSKIKEELYPLHFNQSMVLEAPAFLTFCADFNRMRKWLELNEAPQNFDNFMSFLIGMIDATLCSQNVAIAAESLGLGICYHGTTLASNKEISKILKLPNQVVPVVGFSLGYPAEEIELRDRLSLDSLVHENTYHDYSAEMIEAIFEQKSTSAMKRYLGDRDLNKILNENKIKNLAQIYTKLKYTRESHLNYSKDVLECLANQGFMNNDLASELSL